MNTEVWAVSPDASDGVAKMVETEHLTFPVLADQDLHLIKTYGILNESSPTVPHPTALVLDRQGTIRFLHLDENYRVRPAPEVLLDALRALGPSEEGKAGS